VSHAGTIGDQHRSPLPGGRRRSASGQEEAVTSAAALDLILLAATILFVNGHTTERTIETTVRLAAALGRRAVLLRRWGQLTVDIDDSARIALGASRIGYAGLIVTMICMGLLAGLSLEGVTLPASSPSYPVPFAYDVIAAGIAVAAYGTFFAMPWRMLPIPILIGMFAHAARWVTITVAGAVLIMPAMAFGLVVPIMIIERLYPSPLGRKQPVRLVDAEAGQVHKRLDEQTQTSGRPAA
jgi:hypothetical protein